MKKKTKAIAKSKGKKTKARVTLKTKAVTKSKARLSPTAKESATQPGMVFPKTARVGIFGGTFNPFHVGHLKVIQTARTRAALTHVAVVPANQNPLKVQTDGPTLEQRLEMVRLGVEEAGSGVQMDEQEVMRGGVSYTIDTIKSYASSVSPERLFLIIGADQFEELDRWKKPAEILKHCNILVMTRPEIHMPGSLEEMPQCVREQASEFERDLVVLKSGQYVEFIRLTDNAVSASEIRKSVRVGRSTEKLLPLGIETFIRDHGLYAALGPKVGDPSDFVQFCASVLNDRKGIDIKIYDVRNLNSISEYVIIASGTSTRHASALAENVVRSVKEEFNVLPHRSEGLGEGRWVVIDYGFLIVHVFYDFVRKDYRLEELWTRGLNIAVKDGAATPRKSF